MYFLLFLVHTSNDQNIHSSLKAQDVCSTAQYFSREVENNLSKVEKDVWRW